MSEEVACAELAAVMARQHGVVSRAQVAGAGLKPSYIARKVRRREWVRLLNGVYLNHTGVPTWEQRAWAGVLRCEPAALAGESAMRAAIGRVWQSDSAPIRLMVAAHRSLEESPGYRHVRARHFGETVMSNTSPPRQRLEEAVLDVALAKSTELGAVHVVADACRSRATTADRLIAALHGRSRAPRRDWLRGVLVDVRDGTCSVLEHGYLVRVVRPHGLPSVCDRWRTRPRPGGSTATSTWPRSPRWWRSTGGWSTSRPLSVTGTWIATWMQ